MTSPSLLGGVSVADEHKHTLFTLWAQLKEDESAFWMIAAEDEFAWEGNPERCEQEFKMARADAERNGFGVREITIRVPFAQLDAAFQPTVVDGEATG